MKTKKRLAMKNITTLFVTSLYVVSMLCGQTPEVAGLPLSYFLMLILAVLYAVCWIWNIRRGDRGLWRLEHRPDLVVLALIVWNLLSIIGKMFQDPDTGAIHYQFQAGCIVLGLLYFELKEVKAINGWYWDMILYIGLIVTGRMLLEYLCGIQIGWKSEVMGDTGRAASVLLPGCLVSVLRYCFCRDRMRSVFYLLVGAVNFFMLFLNYNIPSLWIMTFAFLAIPVMMRPTAELVKRDMQMFFLYGFMLSNMSILTNYTPWFSRKLTFSLEHSVYLEMLLAVGGMFFFRYWDRIPDNIDLNRLVLRKMRRGYLLALRLLGVVFAAFVLGGGSWAEMQETPGFSVGVTLVKSFALPLHEAIESGKSGWSCCLANSGISTFFLLLLTVVLTTKMRSNHSFAKPQTAGCQLITLAFLAQTFFYAPDIGVLAVYLLFGIMAAFYREQPERVRVTVLHLNKEMERNEEKYV